MKSARGPILYGRAFLDIIITQRPVSARGDTRRPMNCPRRHRSRNCAIIARAPLRRNHLPPRATPDAFLTYSARHHNILTRGTRNHFRRFGRKGGSQRGNSTHPLTLSKEGSINQREIDLVLFFWCATLTLIALQIDMAHFCLLSPRPIYVENSCQFVRKYLL